MGLCPVSEAKNIPELTIPPGSTNSESTVGTAGCAWWISVCIWACVCMCWCVFSTCVYSMCAYTSDNTSFKSHQQVWKHWGMWWNGDVMKTFFFKDVRVMLRCPECTEIVPQSFITAVLSTLTSVIRHTRLGTNLCLYSCLVVCLALPWNPSVPGVCNKRAGQSPCPWESIRGI